ncbi:hypothetical protein SLE2022_177450 [Rubroshorea leprosula]
MRQWTPFIPGERVLCFDNKENHGSFLHIRIALSCTYRFPLQPENLRVQYEELPHPHSCWHNLVTEYNCLTGIRHAGINQLKSSIHDKSKLTNKSFLS